MEDISPRTLIKVIGVVIIIIAVCLLLDRGCYSLFPKYAVKQSQPTGKGEVIFLVDDSSIRFNGIWFYVKESGKYQSYIVPPMLLGGSYTRDGQIAMEDAVCSNDGSLIAVRGYMRSIDNKLRFVEAYDFQKHQGVAEARPYDDAKSQEIKRLFHKRGGLSKSIIPYPGGGGAVPLFWWEAKQY